MIIGVPKEIKNHEYRVGVVQAGVRALVKDGHQVLIQTGAGEGSGILDEEFAEAGAMIVPGAEDVYGRAEMVMKVKEPLPQEIPLLREGQILFAYLHLAPAPELTRGLLQRRIIGVAYETIQLPDGSLPLLTPMSVVAGRMAVQVGAHYLEKGFGGRGVLLGGVPGVARGKVAIIGAGTVGASAAKIAIGLGAYVTIVDNNVQRLAYLDDIFGTRINTLMSNYDNIALSVKDAHLVIGAVLIPGARAPKLVTREMIGSMKRGDRGGGRLGGPGRLLRDHQTHDPHRPDLFGGRGDPLRGDQHAGRRGPHLHLCPDQRHPPLCPGPGQQGDCPGRGRRPGLGQGGQRVPGRSHLRQCGRRPGVCLGAVGEDWSLRFLNPSGKLTTFQ